MKKHIFAAATFALLSAPLVAMAAPQEPAFPPPGPAISAEDLSAFTDARVAGLKAGLKLTPEQEKNWPQLEAAIRDNGRADAARIAERREHAAAEHGRAEHGAAEHGPGEHDAIGALHRHAQALAARSAEIEKLAQAATPLYASLDAGQKRRFDALLRHAAQEHAHHAFAGGEGPGFGGPAGPHPGPR